MEQGRSTSLRFNSKTNKPIPRDLSESLGKLPPQVLDLEEAVLGAIMLEKAAMQVTIAMALKAEHFYSDAHREIYSACMDLFSASEPVDMRTVVSQLRKNGKLEIVGGAYIIAELTAKVSSAANIEHHAKIVQEMAMKRMLIQIASEIHHSAYEDTQDVFKLLEESQRAMMLMDIRRSGQRTAISMKDLFVQTVIGLQAKSALNGVTGIPSGFIGLDRITNGWQKSDLILAAARPGQGKALSLNEDILTETGWLKMRDIKVGMKAAGSDGKFYPITGVYPQGVRDVYDVYFDDRTVVRCDGEHLWEVQSREDRKRNKGSRVIALDEILKEGIILKDNRKNFSVKTIQPIEYSATQHLIHPYVLGVLIGDGALSRGSVTYSNPEEDITARLQSFLPEGFIVHHLSPLTKSIIKTEPGKNSRLISELRRLRLFGKRSFEKHIPSEYLYDSIESRLWLLRGLMDSDGYVNKAGYEKSAFIEYVTTSKQLADDVAILVGSLGAKSVVRERMGKYKDVNGRHKTTRPNFRMHLSFPETIVPVSSEKHLSKWGRKLFFKKFIADIKPAGKQETQCISVASPDNLFITNNYTLTHNTAFMLSTARRASIEKPVAIFSLEMSASQLGERLVSSDFSVENDKIRSGVLSDGEWAVIAHDHTKLSQAKLWIDDTANISIFELRSKCIRLKQEHDIQMIVIDYLQLMKGDQSGNREQEIASISRGLKNLAKELDVPVIALSQLSRAVEQRADKHPQLSDLRESGSLEMDADIVIFLYRPEYYKITVDSEGMPTAGVCEVDVAKHRNGGTGMVKIKFQKYFARFVDWDSELFSADPAPQKPSGKYEPKYDPSEARNKKEDKTSDDLPF